jgi:hypothetical protein
MDVNPRTRGYDVQSDADNSDHSLENIKNVENTEPIHDLDVATSILNGIAQTRYNSTYLYRVPHGDDNDIRNSNRIWFWCAIILFIVLICLMLYSLYQH